MYKVHAKAVQDYSRLSSDNLADVILMVVLFNSLGTTLVIGSRMCESLGATLDLYGVTRSKPLTRYKLRKILLFTVSGSPQLIQA